MFEAEARGLLALYETHTIRVPRPYKVACATTPPCPPLLFLPPSLRASQAGPLPRSGSYIIMEFIELGASNGGQVLFLSLPPLTSSPLTHFQFPYLGRQKSDASWQKCTIRACLTRGSASLLITLSEGALPPPVHIVHTDFRLVTPCSPHIFLLPSCLPAPPSHEKQTGFRFSATTALGSNWTSSVSSTQTTTSSGKGRR